MPQSKIGYLKGVLRAKKGVSAPFRGIVITIMTSILALYCSSLWADTASYYTVASCLREGTSGIMANGERLNDNSYICASWDYPFGTRLLVTNLANGKKVVVVVKDRGPAKRLYRKGRKIDLSLAAMRSLDGVRKGIIQVQIEKVS